MGRRLRSVRGRITLVATALVAVTLTVASVLILRLVEDDLVATTRDTLGATLETTARSPDGNRGFRIELDERTLTLSGFTRDDEGLAVGDLFDGNILAARILLDLEEGEIVDLLDPDSGEEIDDEDLFADLQDLIFESLEVEGGDAGDVLVGASALDEVDASVRAVRRALVAIVPVLVLAFSALIWWLVGRALRPVHAITREVDNISTSNLHDRVPAPGGDDEVSELATVMNGMLDRLEEGRDRQRQFSADASHELRSPLSTVRAAAELIEDGPGQARVAGLAADIVAEVDRLDVLTGDLLALSRLDEGRADARMEPVDLAALVRGDVPSDIEIDSAGPGIVLGNDRLLARALRNLVDNARRHADHDVSIAVTARGDEIVVTVADDGEGVAPEHRAAVFDRFTRLDEARARDAGGAGLGLALTRAIVEHHRGTISVGPSAELGGAAFTMRLPAIGPDTDEPMTGG